MMKELLLMVGLLGVSVVEWVCDAGGKVEREGRRGECFNTCG